LDEILAFSPCDVLIPWTYAGSFEKAEWFKGSNSSDEKLMTYTANTGEVVVENGTNMEYNNDTDSIGIILKGMRTDFSSTVKLTLNKHSTEESTTSISFQTGM